MVDTAAEGTAADSRAGGTAEYHCSDFTWESLRDTAAPLVREKQQQAAKHRAAAAESACACLGPQQISRPTADQNVSWEAFHKQHCRTAFFKPRRYLMTEFPVLQAQGPPLHVVELGCGAGASLLPILQANPCVRATACDVSATAIRLLCAAAEAASIAAHRLQAEAFDATSSSPLLVNAQADCALLVFTLSAVPPLQMAAVLELAFNSLRPGGLLLSRDYALYDVPMLRFRAAQMLEPNLYMREDGTLAYFFTVEDLQRRASAVGFAVLECSYACVYNKNRKTGSVLRRAFVHGIFRRPATTTM